MIKSDFDTYDSGAKAVPRCTMCGWYQILKMPSSTSPKKVTEKANKVMTRHLRIYHGVNAKTVSKGKKWI